MVDQGCDHSAMFMWSKVCVCLRACVCVALLTVDNCQKSFVCLIVPYDVLIKILSIFGILVVFGQVAWRYLSVRDCIHSSLSGIQPVPVQLCILYSILWFFSASRCIALSFHIKFVIWIVQFVQFFTSVFSDHLQHNLLVQVEQSVWCLCVHTVTLNKVTRDQNIWHVLSRSSLKVNIRSKFTVAGWKCSFFGSWCCWLSENWKWIWETICSTVWRNAEVNDTVPISPCRGVCCPSAFIRSGSLSSCVLC